MKNLYFVALFFIIVAFVTVGAERTKGKIYYDVSTTSSFSCIRRMNGTHQIGCTSKPNGNVGVVHFVQSQSDADWLIDHGPDEPYAVLLNSSTFNRDLFVRLKDSGKVNGFMIIENTPNAYSPDAKCPNDQSGMYRNTNYSSCAAVTWNPVGNGLMWADLSLPVFILTSQADVTFIIEQCYKPHNEPINGVARDSPLCAVQLKGRMDGAKDSETCIRRTRHWTNLSPDRYCDPLGDYNIYGTIKAKNNSETRPEKSVIIAATRLDSFSMFDQTYPGDDSQVSGIVALLAAAEAVGKVKDKIKTADNTRDIMFTFFNGEAFDYIGSDRLVYEMLQDNFPARTKTAFLQPIGLSHVSHFLELSQLAYRDEGKLWMHTDPITRPSVKPETDALISLLKEVAGSQFEEVSGDKPLPPASVQSFLKKTGNQAKHQPFPAVVLTDHKAGFTNKYYNSRFEVYKGLLNYTGNVTDWYDEETTAARDLAQVADSVANVLYRLAMNGTDNTTRLEVNVTTVANLLYCFLVSPKCPLFQQVLTKTNADILTAKPYPFYVSVDTVENHVTLIVNKLLHSYLGDRVNVSEDNCKNKDDGQQVVTYAWMQGPDLTGICVAATVNKSIAVSKAFELDNYDYKSGEFSTWTESSWQTDAMLVRVFLIPSKHLENGTLAVGILLLLGSCLLTYLVNQRVDIIFSKSSRNRAAGYDTVQFTNSANL